MAAVIHMMLYAVFGYLVVLILIQFHQKSYQLPWGYTSLLELLLVVLIFIVSNSLTYLAIRRRS